MSAETVDFTEVGTLTMNAYCCCGASCKVSSNPPAHARQILDTRR